MPLQAPEVGPAFANVDLLVERVLAEGVGAAGEDVEDDRARRVDVAGEVGAPAGRPRGLSRRGNAPALIGSAGACAREIVPRSVITGDYWQR